MGPEPSILRQIDQGVGSVSKIASAINANPKSVAKNCRSLLRRNFVSYDTKKRFYGITSEGISILHTGHEITSGSNKPRRPQVQHNTFRAYAWRAMRIKGKFAIDDLLSVLNDGSAKNARNNLHKFIRALVDAGYLKEMHRRAPGNSPYSNGFKRWWLEKDTGPLTPMIRQDSIYDPNTGETVARLKNDVA